jgi:p21-activated kinase 1
MDILGLDPNNIRAKTPITNKPSVLDDFLSSDNPHDIFANMERIDEGSSGIVYKCVHKPTKKICAVKVISRRALTEKALVNEIEMQQTCQHANIVEFIGAFVDHRDLWIAMEYIDGGKITDWLLKSTFKEPEIAYICREVLKALSYMHENYLIHRDIKSDNCLVSRTGKVKLADFGFCANLEGTHNKRHSVVGTVSLN